MRTLPRLAAMRAMPLDQPLPCPGAGTHFPSNCTVRKLSDHPLVLLADHAFETRDAEAAAAGVVADVARSQQVQPMLCFDGYPRSATAALNASGWMTQPFLAVDERGRQRAWCVDCSEAFSAQPGEPASQTDVHIDGSMTALPSGGHHIPHGASASTVVPGCACSRHSAP